MAKELTLEQKTAVIMEANRILKQVATKWLPQLNEKQYPTFFVKRGGSSGGYYIYYEEKTHLIGLRYNVWTNLSIAQKRLLVIHEFIHSLGLNHSGLKSYLSAFDLMSKEVYLQIYGEDEELMKFRESLQDSMKEFEKSVKLINQRKLVIKNGKLV